MTNQRKLSSAEVDALVAEELAGRAAERRAEEQATEVARRLTLIDGFGADVFADNDVLRFTKTHTKNDESVKYTYAALKVNDAWYVTGEYRNPGKLSWDGLLAFIVAGDEPADSVEVLRFDTVLRSTPSPWISKTGSAPWAEKTVTYPVDDRPIEEPPF